MQKISNEKKNIRDVGSGQLSTKISIKILTCHISEIVPDRPKVTIILRYEFIYSLSFPIMTFDLR